jgi:pimeloyl-ACP methyl ester carboxylesterase
MSAEGANARTTVALPGGRLEVLDLPGQEPALVLLHEGLGSLGLWRDFPDRLHQATGRRVVVYSRYGYGYSDPPRQSRSDRFLHEEALETLPALLERLTIAKPILIGHSDGASISLIYASYHDDLSGVVVMAPHVFVESEYRAPLREIREAFENEGLKERMAKHHADPDAAFYRWNGNWLDPIFDDWDIRPGLQNINAPLLLIQGIRDQYGSLRQLDEIERSVAESTPVTRLEPDCRHAPQFEAPEETLQAIVEFVTAAGSSTGSPRARP